MSYRITIIRKNIKNTYLRIKPPDHLLVSCSKHVTVDQIDQFIKSKQKWIDKRFALLKTQSSTVLPFYNGAVIRLAQKEYTLYFQSSNRNKVSTENNQIKIEIKDIDDESLKHRLLLKWYTKCFKQYTSERTTALYRENHRYGIEMPQRISIKNMSSRWGSYSKKTDTLSLATRLGAYDKDVIDSVIYHELAHTRYMDHQKDFHVLLRTMMPNYPRAHRALKEHNAHASWFKYPQDR